MNVRRSLMAYFCKQWSENMIAVAFLDSIAGMGKDCASEFSKGSSLRLSTVGIDANSPSLVLVL